eukprot:c2445_g1_i1.p1 GENE.c2445_g1_i1~~c2445_g1_i1.p1  ORF type:complete len:532 (+),score=122.39 c2445_g1_i1:1365-2960(+)
MRLLLVLVGLVIGTLALSAVDEKPEVKSDPSDDAETHSSVSGLAWDKHDFEVANNKGGDVKVEINLAAPMSTGNYSTPVDDDDDMPDLAKLFAPEDPVSPIDLMSMMRDLMITMKPEEPPAMNISDVIEEFRASLPAAAPALVSTPLPTPDYTEILAKIAQAIKENQPAPVQYVQPPQPQQVSPEAILNALRPPAPLPPPPQQPFNIGDFMREMRETLAANKPPPTPPAGMDPQFLDLMRQTISDMRDMQKSLHQAQPPPPPPLMPPAIPAPIAAAEPAPVTLPNVFIPPPVPQQAFVPSQDSIKDMIKDMLQQIKPPPTPTLPQLQGSEEISKLREMFRQQQEAVKPIILPPPVVPIQNSADFSMNQAPPPPPPATPTQANDQMREELLRMMPKPQRIPAPPTVNVKKEAAPGCCPPPSPEDRRVEIERCPLINGRTQPRCKRELPPTAVSVVPVKCTRAPCAQGTVDEDGDVNIDQPISLSGSIPQGIPQASFNPKKLLRALCSGGLCDQPSDSDPRRGGVELAQSGSV